MMKILKTENSLLKSRLSSDQATGTSCGIKLGVASNPDSERLHLLTKKLQDAQKLYDRVKQDINKLKQVQITLNSLSVLCAMTCTLVRAYMWCVYKSKPKICL